ncbi:MAG: LLM class F420-dependent oxidoreductase [Gammaproteobacteria bacterium]
MKFGISIPNNQGVESVRELMQIALEAEALGYDSVWVSEHLFHASYVAERLGNAPYHEALTVLTAVASVTSRVRLGTSVLVLPWHHPARLAKQIATLDALSQGRVDLGVGVAQVPDEFENLGVAYASRGRVTDEAIDAMRCLWREETPEFAGEFYRFSGLKFSPKPVQDPVPILIGGNSERALRRVREKGDGWHAMTRSVDDVRESISKTGGKPTSIRQVVSFTDSTPDKPLHQRRVMKGTVEELRALVAEFEVLGVDELVIDANNMDIQVTRTCFQRFFEEVASRT